MENRRKDGDYVPDGQGGLVRLAGRDALLARVLYRLQARRGAFPLLPELGSRLWQLPALAPAERRNAALAAAAEALAGEPVTVEGVTLTQRDGALQAAFQLRYQGEMLQTEVSV